MITFLQTISDGIFLISCGALALLVASFFWQLTVYALGKGDDAERSAAKKLVLRYSAYLFLFMLAWWFLPFALRLTYATLLSWTVNR